MKAARGSRAALILGGPIVVTWLVLFLGMATSPSAAEALKPPPSASGSPSPSSRLSAQQQVSNQQPNADGFLGTVASLSGTVAAILGGFVLAALLNISSERNSMVELLKERERSSNALARQLDTQREENDRLLSRLLTDWLRAAYRHDSAIPSAEEILRRIDTLGLSLADSFTNLIVDNYISNRKKADAAIQASRNDIAQDTDARSFDVWAARHPAAGMDLGLLRDAFERTVESVERQERLASWPPAGVGGALQANSALRADSLIDAEAEIRLWFQSPASVALRRLQEDLAREVSMKDELSDRLATLRLPSNLGLGVAVFAFIVILGVIYPLSLMPSTPESFTPTVDLIIKVTVAAEMISIMAYIYVVARGIRHRTVP